MFPELQEVNRVPSSASRIVGLLGVLLSTAMLTALLTSAASAFIEQAEELALMFLALLPASHRHHLE